MISETENLRATDNQQSPPVIQLEKCLSAGTGKCRIEGEFVKQ